MTTKTAKTTATKTTAVKTVLAPVNIPSISSFIVEKKKSVSGNIGRNFETKISKAGKSYTKFSIGVNDPEFNTCTWYNVVCFGDISKTFAETFQVGDLVAIFGDLKATEYTRGTGEKAGETAIYLEVIASSVRLIYRKPEAEIAPQLADDCPF
jgi:single-stranded DNA-binding protein